MIDKLNLDNNKIYIMYDESNNEVSHTLKKYNLNGIPYDKSRLICNMPIKYESNYIKINYFYRGGLIPIANLVFIDQKEYTTMLDSIIYPERLLFIVNNNKFVYQEKFYEDTVNLINSIILDSKNTSSTSQNLQLNNPYISLKHNVDNNSFNLRLSCALVSHLRIILYFYTLGITSNSKKSGYILRNMERQVFTYFLIEDLTINENDIYMILDSIYLNGYFNYHTDISLKSISRKIYNEFIIYKNMVKKSLNKVDIRLKSKEVLDLEDIKYFHETLGVNSELLSKHLFKINFFNDKNFKDLFQNNDDRQYPYNFEDKLNNIEDPFKWADERRHTKFYKS